jgi:hypothetical protein
MRTIQTTVYRFSELSEEAKEKSIETNRDINCGDSFWSECVIEDAKEQAKTIGIDIDHIYYSGFSSQGDGACFDGRYLYKAGAVKAMQAENETESETQLSFLGVIV